MKKATPKPKSAPGNEQQWVTPRGTAKRPPRASSSKPPANGVPKLNNLSALAADDSTMSARGGRSARRSPVVAAFATPRTQDEITMRRSMMFNDSDSEEEEYSFHLRSVGSARGTPIQRRSPEKSTILTPSADVPCLFESSSILPAAAAQKQLDIVAEFGRPSPDVSVSSDAPAPINGIQTSLRQLEESKRALSSRQPTSRDRPAFASAQDDSDDEDVPRDKLRRGAEEKAEERAARAKQNAIADAQKGNTDRRNTPQNQSQASKPPTPSNPAPRKEQVIKKKNLFRSADDEERFEELTKEVARLGEELRVQKRVASAQAKAVLDVRRETGDSVVELRALVRTLQARVEQLENVTGVVPRLPADENDGSKPQPLKSRDFRQQGKAGLTPQRRSRTPNKVEGVGAMAMKAV